MYTRRDKRMFEWYDPLDSLYQFCVQWLRTRRSAAWPRIHATIRDAQARVVESEDGSSVGWRPVVWYDCELNGIRYQGKTTGELWYYENDAAAEAAKSLIGAALPIRCNPSKPAQSLYMQSDGGPAQLLPAHPDSGLVTLSLK
ncbi:MAG: hypothetical protein ACXVIO_09545 [Candidatus Angelobacter sp.]